MVTVKVPSTAPHRTHSISLAVLILAGLALIACQAAPGLPDPVPAGGAPGAPQAGDNPAQQAGNDPAAPPLIPTPEPEGYWIEPGVPASLTERVVPALVEAGLVEAAAPETAIVRIRLDPGPEALLSAQWVYAVAAPFPTVPDGLTWAGLQSYWQHGTLDGLPDFGGTPQFVLAPDVVALLEARLGPPAPGLPLQVSDNTASLVDRAWSARPAITILPFDTLTPRWKVLAVDGRVVLDRAFSTEGYPLVVTVGLEAAGERGQQVAAGLEARELWRATNRDPARITTVVLTGVTALVRATAKTMELRGVNYPADAIMPFFEGADILHTSNEASFTPNCPPPEWFGEPTGFCSSPAHFPLLQTIGLDVIELTGNHINDVGTPALSYTLDLYDSNGIAYYGGGRNLEDARAPRILTAPDGTRIAFVGCNVVGPWGAFATAESPGAAPCEDWTWLLDTIRALKANGQADLVIATLQHWEHPGYMPQAEPREEFDALAAAGADIVSGSQAHQPQGFAFVDGRFVHYGVGNLFFDQMDYIENRQMFADKHILYEGRHISTLLFTGLIEDWSQPNPMTPEDRAGFLRMIFEVSGW